MNESTRLSSTICLGFLALKVTAALSTYVYEGGLPRCRNAYRVALFIDLPLVDLVRQSQFSLAEKRVSSTVEESKL